MFYKQLTLIERYKIKALLQAGTSKKRIAEILGVHKSTVFRELKRNEGEGGYSSEKAQDETDERRRFACKAMRCTSDIKKRIECLLSFDLSPEQISGRLKREEGIRISHETIYTSMCGQTKKSEERSISILVGLGKRDANDTVKRPERSNTRSCEHR